MSVSSSSSSQVQVALSLVVCSSKAASALNVVVVNCSVLAAQSKATKAISVLPKKKLEHEIFLHKHTRDDWLSRACAACVLFSTRAMLFSLSQLNEKKKKKSHAPDSLSRLAQTHNGSSRLHTIEERSVCVRASLVSQFVVLLLFCWSLLNLVLKVVACVCVMLKCGALHKDFEAHLKRQKSAMLKHAKSYLFLAHTALILARQQQQLRQQTEKLSTSITSSNQRHREK